MFTEHPDQWKLLAERPELAARATEESMRVLGAIRGTARFATDDIEYKDVLFPRDTFISTSFVAANNDDAVFADPETFDITREGASSPHLTFGSGIHYCLGAWLARAELQEALPILAQRMPDLEVDGVIEWKPDCDGHLGAGAPAPSLHACVIRCAWAERHAVGAAIALERARALTRRRSVQHRLRR